MKVVTLTGGVMLPDPNPANPYQTLPVVMPKGHVTLMNLLVSVYPISH